MLMPLIVSVSEAFAIEAEGKGGQEDDLEHANMKVAHSSIWVEPQALPLLQRQQHIVHQPPELL